MRGDPNCGCGICPSCVDRGEYASRAHKAEEAVEILLRKLYEAGVEHGKTTALLWIACAALEQIVSEHVPATASSIATNALAAIGDRGSAR